jgi:hypothetical protein
VTTSLPHHNFNEAIRSSPSDQYGG